MSLLLDILFENLPEFMFLLPAERSFSKLKVMKVVHIIPKITLISK